jgi:hypothetical protein
VALATRAPTSVGRDAGTVRSGSRSGGRTRVGVALAVFALVLIAPVATTVTAQPASRYAATAAYAEHGSIDLTRYRSILGVDKARYDGKWRSDKAPGQPVLGVPVYLLGRALGLPPALRLHQRGDLGVWWQTLWFAMVPFALVLVSMYRTAARFAPKHALHASLAIGFATLMLPHAANLYGHTLAALLGFASWLVAEPIIDARDGTVRRCALAGLLGGCAFAVEYHLAAAATVVVTLLAVRGGRRAIGWYFAGAAAPVALTALFQQVAFGAPWRLAYGYLVPRENGGRYGIPTLSSVGDIVVGKHGLLLSSPIVLLAVAAAIVTARSTTGALRVHAVVALAVLVPYVALVASWSGTALLEQPGPRYVIPALPFLAVPLAAAWHRWSCLATVVAAWGALIMVAGVFVFHLVPVADTPLHAYAVAVAHGRFEPTLWTKAFGRAGWAPYTLTVAASARFLFRAHRATALEP